LYQFSIANNIATIIKNTILFNVSAYSQAIVKNMK